MPVLAQRHLSCDVLVAGGGPAGLAAAVAAARLGCRTILCQDRSMLGGNASSEVRMHIMGADAVGCRSEPLVTEAREGGIIEELRLATAVTNPQRSASVLDLIHYELVRAEPNLTLMTDTTVSGAEVEGGRIVAAIADRPMTEERFRITAHSFLDCTGDGRLGAEAGAAFHRGREGKADHDEADALPQGDHKSLGATILFTARRHDRPMPFTAPPWVRRFEEADFAQRQWGGKEIDRGLEYGFWWCEWGGELDTIRDQPRIRDELTGIVLGIWDYIKNRSGRPETANWAIEWFGVLPGKRESRRFIGQHVLTQTDLQASRHFPDAIAYGGWPMDTHPPEGMDRTDLKPCHWLWMDHLYDIPLSSCVATGIPNLGFAGRNHSATHLAFASTRVMATCAVMGQGLGTATAWAVQHGRDLGSLSTDPVAMGAIQQRLLRDDNYLIGRTNADPHDLAPRARLSASSARPGAGPEQVVSGQTRSVHGHNAAPKDRALPGLHRWMAAGVAGEWLELRWEHPVAIGSVQLIHDTGLHRLLCLSHSDGAQAKMVYGQPQPETLRDYAIDGEVDGAWVELHREDGNWQRRRVHAVTATVTALRLRPLATQGLDHARLMEIRVYPPHTPRWTA